jgi:hypothetical protein
MDGRRERWLEGVSAVMLGEGEFLLSMSTSPMPPHLLLERDMLPEVVEDRLLWCRALCSVNLRCCAVDQSVTASRVAMFEAVDAQDRPGRTNTDKQRMGPRTGCAAREAARYVERQERATADEALHDRPTRSRAIMLTIR